VVIADGHPLTVWAKRPASPDRAWVVLPNADHAAHIEHWHDAFIHAIASFLTRPRKTP
jgi:pimeloyl-ACP methyl ester carboxylesterase